MTGFGPRARRRTRKSVHGLLATLLFLACRASPPAPAARDSTLSNGIGRLPTGVMLDPAGQSTPIGAMPLAAVLAPGGRRVVLSLSGWRVQGIQVIDRSTGAVVQTLVQPSAFVGLAFSPDGQSLYASGGNQDVIYRYRWSGDSATLADSIVLAPKERAGGTRYPAGLALSPDGRTLYVAENLGDALAVVELPSGRIKERRPTARYPYAVAVAPNGQVFVSSWTGASVLAFRPRPDGTLGDAATIPVGRHPSALLLNRTGSRLFVASASTDRVTVVDTRSQARLADLLDAPPEATEGSTPNALALSGDETRLYVAEADNNAVAVIRLGSATRDATAGTPDSDSLVARIPVGWYPSALLTAGESLYVANGKGNGTRANPDGPTPSHPRTRTSRTYTLGQLDGTLTTLTADELRGAALSALTRRVARANGWDRPLTRGTTYPPFEHVVYIIKENRTFDQVLGDLPQSDGDSSLVFFPRRITPNSHALAERFGIFDRFFVNAEVSPDGHNWSTAAYATDYLEKTVPSEYSSRGRTYDYEGTNRGFKAANIPDDDAAEPANGYVWDAAVRAGITLRNYGEFVVRTDSVTGARPDETQATGRTHPGRYMGSKKALRAVTSVDYPGFDLDVRDQRRADVWLRDFASDVQRGTMPALEIVRLPNDHTAGMLAGSPTPVAYVADNDLALGRIVEAVSRSPFWKSTVFFVVEDDSQNGPDHVDSHRSLLFVLSAYSPTGAVHRWVNTTDVVATLLEILHAPHLSKFDTHARPLREIWTATADLRPYVALTPAVDTTAVNPKATPGARQSARLDLSREDRAEEDAFNRVLWTGIKGKVPYPGARRASIGELRRSY